MSVERLGVEAWESFDRDYPAATFFARPAWAKALACAYPHLEPAPLRVRLDDGVAVVPLVRDASSRLRFREYYGFPLGGYTMALREDGSPATQRDWNVVLEHLKRYCDAVTLVPWPLSDLPQGGSRRAHETGVVDLRDGLDGAMRNVAGIFRRMAGQATRRGVVCCKDDSPTAVDDYYALLEASARRWGIGKPAIPKSLIAALVREGGSGVEVWFATAESMKIAGGVAFYGSREFFFWSAAMDAEYGRLRPSNALNFALLNAACERGMSWYNLGSSEGLPGVARFKHDLGAADTPYDEVRVERLPYRVVRRLRTAAGALRTSMEQRSA